MPLNYHFHNESLSFLVMTTGILENGIFHITDVIDIKGQNHLDSIDKYDQVDQNQLIVVAQENDLNLDLYFNEYFLKILYELDRKE